MIYVAINIMICMSLVMKIRVFHVEDHIDVPDSKIMGIIHMTLHVSK